MIRKLSIVAIAHLVGKGSVTQLTCTGFLSVAWLCLHVKAWPYRFLEDNLLKARRPASSHSPPFPLPDSWYLPGLCHRRLRRSRMGSLCERSARSAINTAAWRIGLAAGSVRRGDPKHHRDHAGGQLGCTNEREGRGRISERC